MKTVFVICEGQTESKFVSRILAPYFSALNTTLVSPIIRTSFDKKVGRVYKGSGSSYGKIVSEIKRYEKIVCSSKDKYITTMLDFYGLSSDMPGYSEALAETDAYNKVSVIESAFKQDLNNFGSFFIPYIQLHEFEALLFSDFSKIEECFFDVNLSKLKEDVSSFENPELINNGVETAPSKRIKKYISSYSKTGDGITILENIGLETLRKKCRHFSSWIAKLEEVAKLV